MDGGYGVSGVGVIFCFFFFFNEERERERGLNNILHRVICIIWGMVLFLNLLLCK